MNDISNSPRPEFEGNNQPNNWGVIPNPSSQQLNVAFPPPPTVGREPFDDSQIDPDNPGWGVLSGLGVWVASVAALFGASIVFMILWFVIKKASFPQTQEGFQELQKNPSFMLYQIASTIFGHILTIGVCWAVVTRIGKRSFGKAIGWRWKESLLIKIGVILGVIVLTVAIEIILSKFIHDPETPFSELLKLSKNIRVVVVILAVFSAPLVEELVYRSVLYAPFKRALGTVGAVVIVTVLFALVHVPQYIGAWGGKISGCP